MYFIPYDGPKYVSYDFGVTQTLTKKRNEAHSSEVPSSNTHAIPVPAKKPHAP